MHVSSIVTILSTKWQLYDLQELHRDSTVRYIAAAIQKPNLPVVLKINHDHNAFMRELDALRAYVGCGAVQVLDADIVHSALLLERILPGESLRSYFPKRDDEAIVHCIEVMKKLHEVHTYDPSSFTTVEKTLTALHTETSLVPNSLLMRARECADRLLHTSATSILLHGDLHQENILASGRHGWVAIDPHGRIGEPLYDVGAFIRNPVPYLLEYHDPDAIIGHRIDRFAELLNADKSRVRDWSFVQAVLAACWSVQDKESPNAWIKIAEIIESA